MLEAMFAPRSVAVIGASPNPTSLGHMVLKNILDHGYGGLVFPIHPKVAEILGRQAYPSVLAVPELIDLAVIVIPPQRVLHVVDDCGEKGVKALVVISAGFKEVGGEGKELERQLVGKVRSYGMRMIGPNSLGLIDTHSRLNASFAGLMPDQGSIALMSQSGAICTAILDWSKSQGIGFSRFVSLGNKADVDEVALLHAWNHDPQSKVILAYLEDISDGPAFIAAAREVTRNTPVVAIKSGTTTAGSLAAAAHTGSLPGSESAYESAFAQSGILRARTVNELFDLAMLFASQPMIKGDRVAVVTNSGGMGILAADTVERGGLRMARFSPELIAYLQQSLPPAASVYNPIDVLGDAHCDRYRVAMSAALAAPDVDGLIVLLTPQAQTDLVATAEAVAEVAALHSKPVVTSFMGGYSLGAALDLLKQRHIPNYTFPERAVQSLAAMYRHYERTQRPTALYRHYPVDINQIGSILNEVRQAGRVELSETEVRLVLSAYGLRVPESRLARSPEEAVQLASVIGYPVVMKISSSDILLKSEIGAVRVGVADAGAARDSYELIDFRAHKYWPNAHIRGVMVQELVRPGRDLLITITRDPQFGPLIALGLSGVYVEVFKDIAFRIAPISEQEVEAQICSLRAYPLLRGIGGECPSDLLAIKDTVLRMSQLANDFPQIVEMDINPLVAYGPGKGAVVLDARIIVQ